MKLFFVLMILSSTSWATTVALPDPAPKITIKSVCDIPLLGTDAQKAKITAMKIRKNCP